MIQGLASAIPLTLCYQEVFTDNFIALLICAASKFKSKLKNVKSIYYHQSISGSVASPEALAAMVRAKDSLITKVMTLAQSMEKTHRGLHQWSAKDQ